MIVTPGRLFFLYVLLSKRFTHTDSNLIMIVIPGRPSFLYVLLSERFTHTDGDLVIHFDLGQTQTETAYKFLWTACFSHLHSPNSTIYRIVIMTDSYRPPYNSDRQWTPASAPSEAALNYDDADVNRIPINPRRSNAAVPAQSSRLWDEDLNSLMHRTIRAYDLVVNYDRDSYGGTRWSREDIARIRDVGAYLHGDVRDLKHWSEVVAKEGEQDAYTMDKIRDDVENLRKYCDQIQAIIRDTERVPLRQRMKREDGVQAGQNVDDDHGFGGGKNNFPRGGTLGTDFSLPPDTNQLVESTQEGEDMDVEMSTDLEEKLEVVDPTLNPRQADWATAPSKRFAW